MSTSSNDRIDGGQDQAASFYNKDLDWRQMPSDPTPCQAKSFAAGLGLSIDETLLVAKPRALGRFHGEGIWKPGIDNDKKWFQLNEANQANIFCGLNGISQNQEQARLIGFPVITHYGKKRDLESFRFCLKFWKLIGLPEPSLQMTTGDGHLLHWYLVNAHCQDSELRAAAVELWELMDGKLLAIFPWWKNIYYVPVPGTRWFGIDRSAAPEGGRISIVGRSSKNSTAFKRYSLAELQAAPVFNQCQKYNSSLKYPGPGVTSVEELDEKLEIYFDNQVLQKTYLTRSLLLRGYLCLLFSLNPEITDLVGRIEGGAVMFGFGLKEAIALWLLGRNERVSNFFVCCLKEIERNKSASDNEINVSILPSVDTSHPPVVVLGSKAERDIQELKARAVVLAGLTDISSRDKKQLLKSFARDLSGAFSSSYIEQVFRDACRSDVGAYDPILPGTELDFTEVPWCLEGVFMKSVLNLLIGMPKTGKTSFVLAFIAAWAKGQSHFLGLRIHGACPPVLLVGTDQPLSDWARMLKGVGLLKGNAVNKPLIALYTAANGLHLNEDGVNRIEEHAKANPGLLVVIDSLTACILPLGIDENSAEIGGPVRDLMSRLEPHEATMILIHHANKSKANSSPAMASRGSGAVPAASSQNILLKPYSPTDDVTEGFTGKVILEASGRGGHPVKQLIQRTNSGWVSHGDGDAAFVQNQMATVISNLSERQGCVLDVIQERWLENDEKTCVKDVVARLPDEFNGPDAERKVRSTFEQLNKKKLIYLEHNVSTLTWPREDIVAPKQRPSGGAGGTGGINDGGTSSSNQNWEDPPF
jgi:hypothetical protein